MARHGLVPGARLVVAVEPHRLSMHGAIVARKPGCCDISRMLGLDVAPANLLLRTFSLKWILFGFRTGSGRVCLLKVRIALTIFKKIFITSTVITSIYTFHVALSQAGGSQAGVIISCERLSKPLEELSDMCDLSLARLFAEEPPLLPPHGVDPNTGTGAEAAYLLFRDADGALLPPVLFYEAQGCVPKHCIASHAYSRLLCVAPLTCLAPSPFPPP